MSSRIYKEIDPKMKQEKESATHLFPTNKQVEKYNIQAMCKI